MKETLEHELKLVPSEGFELPDLQGQPLEPRTFTSTYYDTEDRRLLRRGITLRRRQENGSGLWQLKLPRNGSRLELEAPGGPAGPPAALAPLLVANLRGRPLAPLARLRTQRSGFLVRARGGRAEVVLDRVAVMDARRVTATFDELEVELLEGDERALERIGKELRRAGASDGGAQPKLLRALGLEPGAAPAGLAGALAAQVDELLVRDPGTRLGKDPEELHKMRVATRRLRAFLRAARPLVDAGWAGPLRVELAWLASVLGDVRDLDVLLGYLRDAAADLGEERALAPVLEALEAERGQARAALLEALASERYLDLLDRLEEEPRLRPASVTLEHLAAAEFRKLRRAVRALGAEPADDALHGARIRAKRARYAAELVTGRPAALFVERAKAFQDVVGEHQDAVVAEERLRRLAPTATSVAFAAGRLVERQRARRRAAREAFPRAWKLLEKSGRRAWS